MLKKFSLEEKTIDLLQKQLILSLYKEGLTRDEIKKVLSLSSEKVAEVIKYLKKIK